MYFSPTSHCEPSTPPPDATSSCGPMPETDDDFAFPFTPCALSTAHPASQSGFLYPPFGTTQPSFAEDGSSSFLTTAHESLPSVQFPTWYNAPSGDIGPLMSAAVSGPSESSVYVDQNASAGNTVAAGNQSTSPHEREQKIRDVFPSMMVSAPTSGQAIPLSSGSHPQHEVSWYLVCSDAVVVNGPRNFVPQTIYQPRSQGDKKRYVSLAHLHPPIIFIEQGSPEWGIPISRLLSKQLANLVEGHEPAFASCGPTIGVRLQWTGYHSCHKQVPTRDYTHKRLMINKAKLAKIVARCVRQFMNAMSKQAVQVGGDRRWKVGPRDITVDDVILVSLHHVSQGSWQPQLRLRRIIGTNAVAGPLSLTSPDTVMSSGRDADIK